jgi:uncharacterized protein (UPF0332 family)
MTLTDWQKNGWLKPHPTSPQEIADLLALADRDLKDAKAKGLSDDWRFAIAYNAALQASNAALAASGYAVPKGDSNHFRVIQSIALTIGADDGDVARFDQYRKRRSMSIYDAAGVITKAEVKAIQEFANDLVERVHEWLRIGHPELFPPPT